MDGSDLHVIEDRLSPSTPSLFRNPIRQENSPSAEY